MAVGLTQNWIINYNHFVLIKSWGTANIKPSLNFQKLYTLDLIQANKSFDFDFDFLLLIHFEKTEPIFFRDYYGNSSCWDRWHKLVVRHNVFTFFSRIKKGYNNLMLRSQQGTCPEFGKALGYPKSVYRLEDHA